MISVGVLITVYLVCAQVSQCLWESSISSNVCAWAPWDSLQLDDMGVSEQLKVLNLALYAALHVAADELLARNDLEGNLLAGAAMHSELDLAEAAFAERLDNVVCTDALLGAHLVAEGCVSHDGVDIRM